MSEDRYCKYILHEHLCKREGFEQRIATRREAIRQALRMMEKSEHAVTIVEFLHKALATAQEDKP